MTTVPEQSEKRRRPIWPAAALLALVAAAGLGVSLASTPQSVAPSPAPPAVPQTGSTPQSAVGNPVAVQIPSIGVNAQIVAVGLKEDGAMQTPDFGLAGWYQPGPRPGEPGPAVVAAHVDSKSGPDVFYHLGKLQPGDEILISDAAGAVRRFSVNGSEQVAKDRLPAERIWTATDKPVLRLITCGGRFNRTTGHYDDNIIVYASPR